MSDKDKKDIDELSGIETTGHEWDGLKELNNPLPRWWLWVWAICCVWGFWYFIAYPAWPIPGGATKGTTGYTQYKELAKNQQKILERQQKYLERFEHASFDEVLNDPALYAFATAGGAAAFKDNCATCHGSGAQGGRGYPNLNDDDWIWGGQVTDIYTTLRHGIRVAGDYDTRISQMPAFGEDQLLSDEDITKVVDYVLALSGDKDVSTMPGYDVFQTNCASCHGSDARGLREFGAPNLTDAIWLYGSEYSDVYKTVFYARAGMMPAWKARLDDNTLRQLSVYVHQLGGGEEAAAVEAPESLIDVTAEQPVIIDDEDLINPDATLQEMENEL